MSMKVVVKKVGKEPEIKKIQGTVREFQEMVGGNFKCFVVLDNIICVCNEEGKYLGLTPNFVYNGDVIAGDIFFCADGKDDFESLSEEQTGVIMSIMHMFHALEIKKLEY